MLSSKHFSSTTSFSVRAFIICFVYNLLRVYFTKKKYYFAVMLKIHWYLPLIPEDSTQVGMSE